MTLNPQLKFNIYHDKDTNLGYETNSFLGDFFYSKLFIPFLNLLPAGFSKIIKKSDGAAAHVIEQKTSHNALETLYGSGRTHKSKNIFQKFFRYVWFNMDNPKAVRNRLRLTKKEINLAIRNITSHKKQIKLLSIASGSARSTVEVLRSFDSNDLDIEVSFLDKNPQALECSKALAESLIDKFKFPPVPKNNYPEQQV